MCANIGAGDGCVSRVHIAFRSTHSMAPAPVAAPAMATAMATTAAAAFTALPDMDMLKRQATRVASFVVATFTFTQWGNMQPGSQAGRRAGSRNISNCSSKRAGELVVAPSGTPYFMPHTPCTRHLSAACLFVAPSSASSCSDTKLLT